jgi:hypothetical protein
MDTMTTVVVAGLFSLVSSTVAAFIGKYGFRLPHRSKSVCLEGAGKELICLSNDGTAQEEPVIRDYRVPHGTLTLSGKKVTWEASTEVHEEGRLIARGEMRGKGIFEDGVAYFSYEVKDKIAYREWRGLMLLRVPGFAEVTGYWMSQETAAPNTISIGDVTFRRKPTTGEEIGRG